MSAFLVSDAHIDVLVDALPADVVFAFSPHDETWLPVDIGRCLLRENMLSLSARYGYDVDEAHLAAYCYRRRAAQSPGAILKACDCYVYQACEHDGWETSTAASIIRRIRSAATARVAGYQAAPWGFENSHLAPAAVSIFDL